MYIAHLIDSLTVGGAQTLLVTFAKTLRQINARDATRHKLAVINLGTPTLQHALEELGVVVFPLCSDRLISPAENVALLRILHQEKFDVVHTHLARANILGGLFTWITQTPAVSTLHSTGVELRHRNVKREQIEIWVLRHQTQKIFAVGNSVAQAHRPRLKSKPIEVLLNPVESIPDITPQARASLRQAIMGDPQRTLLIAVGRLLPPKGYPDLLTAFEQVRYAHPGTFLAIAGTGQLKAQLAQQIQRRDLQRHVSLLGNRNDVPQLLKAADIFVNASHREGLPIAVLEAMAAGLPVVATNVGDIAQIVSTTRGIIVPPKYPEALAEAIIHLVAHPEKRTELGRAGLTYVAERHNPMKWARHLLKIYQQLQRG